MMKTSISCFCKVTSNCRLLLLLSLKNRKRVLIKTILFYLMRLPTVFHPIESEFWHCVLLFLTCNQISISPIYWNVTHASHTQIFLPKTFPSLSRFSSIFWFLCESSELPGIPFCFHFWDRISWIASVVELYRYSKGCPWTSDVPASISKVLRLQVFTTLSSFYGPRNRNKDFVHAGQTNSTNSTVMPDPLAFFIGLKTKSPKIYFQVGRLL